MPDIPGSTHISCCFDTGLETEMMIKHDDLEIFFAETKAIDQLYSRLKDCISNDEQIRAEKFHFEQDRNTYISCHAALRLILARKLNYLPSSILFKKATYGKPALSGDSVFFNLAHTRDAFAFAICNKSEVGIDLEHINQGIDIHGIIGSFFSNKEREYILDTEEGLKDRFFLLWTRKEALLKALGIGIVDNLAQIEVSGQKNLLKRELFKPESFSNYYRNYHIYSQKILDNYISIALPLQTNIKINHLNEETLPLL